MKLLHKGILAVSVVALGAVAGTIAGESDQDYYKRSDAFMRRFTELLTTVQSTAPLEVTAADLVYASLDGMLELLDPHTSFLRPEAFAQMRERQQGSFHGIGVIISIRGDKVTVITPVEGTPAARLGLRAGDTIEAIDGTPTEGLDLDQVARRLRGPEGTQVTVTISRPGLTAPLEITLTRARVPSDSIQYAFMLDDTTAYVRISDFIRNTGEEFRRAMTRLKEEGATRLVLDLRSNPGGIVDSAVEVAAVLLEPEQQVFSTRGRTPDSLQDYRAARSRVRFDGPLVVLVDRGSASAAEIVAGTVQDHDRGIVVGENTFGKGVVQTIFPVRSAGLALTTAMYYTPSGRCIQRGFDSFFDYIRPSDDSQGPIDDGSGVFFTDAGREVFAGGGVTPDRFVRQREVSERLARLIGNSAFFHFAVDFLAEEEDKSSVAREFSVSDEVLSRFRDRVLAEDWLSAADVDKALTDEADRRGIEIGLISEILNAGISLLEGFRFGMVGDDQVQAALQLFDQAAALQAQAREANGSERHAGTR